VINSEHQTIPESERMAVPQVLSFFRLGQLQEITILTHGTANHNYLVKTIESKEYAVKFPIEETRESLENDLAIQEQLVAANISTPAYCRTTNGKFIFDQGIMAVVSPKIEGVHPEAIDEHISFAIGKVLAQFHQAVITLPNPRRGWLSLQTVSRPNSKEEYPFTQTARRLIEEGKRVYQEDLPRGIIHGDLHEGNLLVNKDNPAKITAIFDFEEAEENLFIVDVARTMLAICTTDSGKKLDQSMMDSFTKGYSSERPLSKDEQKNLPAAIKYAAGACILWFMNNGFPEKAQNAISRIESLDSAFSNPS
jgi:Ser/Thr protein kinase RdoA (MazF antagonist)